MKPPRVIKILSISGKSPIDLSEEINEKLKKLNLHYSEIKAFKKIYESRQGKELKLTKKEATLYSIRLKYPYKDATNIREIVEKDELLMSRMKESLEKSDKEIKLEELVDSTCNFYNNLVNNNGDISLILIVQNIRTATRNFIPNDYIPYLHNMKYQLRQKKISESDAKGELKKFFDDKGFTNEIDPLHVFINSAWMYVTDNYPTTSVLDIVAHCAEDNALQYYFETIINEEVKSIQFRWVAFQYDDENSVVKNRVLCHLCNHEFGTRISSLSSFFHEELNK
jgi:hypothetical protein